MIKVAISIKWVSHYRQPFYDMLKTRLNEKGVDLILVYGEPLDLEDRRKKDWIDVPWGIKVQNVSFFGGRVVWQPSFEYIKTSELVIVEHANKLLLNYFLQFRRLFSTQNLAFWGHGRNFQSTDSLISVCKEKWKRFLMFRVDWWFAYNQLCATEIEKNGFPKEKMTSVENAIDTSELKKINAEITAQDLISFKREFKINGKCVGIYCGGMFPEKRLPFLLGCAIKIREKMPEFELIFVGAGTDQKYAESAAEELSWVHYIGPRFGKEKVLAMRTAQIYLMPGLVGLGVLDAFALGLPVITTDYQYHSPEISYVKHRVNGLISEDKRDSYIDSVVEVLSDRFLHSELLEGCKEASDVYTIENMAKNFSEGIIKCLNR